MTLEGQITHYLIIDVDRFSRKFVQSIDGNQIALKTLNKVSQTTGSTLKSIKERSKNKKNNFVLSIFSPSFLTKLAHRKHGIDTWNQLVEEVEKLQQKKVQEMGSDEKNNISQETSSRINLGSTSEILSHLNPDLTPTFTKHLESQRKDYHENLDKGCSNSVKSLFSHFQIMVKILFSDIINFNMICVESEQIFIESPKISLGNPVNILTPLNLDLARTITKHPRSQIKDSHKNVQKGQFNLTKAQLYNLR